MSQSAQIDNKTETTGSASSQLASTIDVRATSLVRHILTIGVATGVSQLVLLAATPIITRIYTPHEYGVFGIYMVMVTVLLSVATLRFDLAISKPSKDSDALSLLALSLICVFVLSALLCGLIPFGGSVIAAWCGTPELSPHLWLIPASLVVFGCTQSIHYWSIRERRVKRSAIGRIARAVTQTIVAICAGMYLTGSFIWLITALIVGQTVDLIVLISSPDSVIGRFRKEVHWRRVAQLVFEYRQMPLYVCNTSLVNVVSKQVFPVVLAVSFGVHFAGLIILSRHMLTIPFNLVARSIWEMVHGQISRTRKPEQRALINRIHAGTSIAFAFPLALMVIYPEVATTVLGDHWSELTIIIPMIAGLVYCNVVSNSISYFSALSCYRAEAIANTSLAVVSCCTIFAVRWVGSPYHIILVYTVASALTYVGIVLFWGIYFNLVRRFVFNMIFSVSLSSGLLALSKTAANENFSSILALITLAIVIYTALGIRYWKHATADGA